MTIQDYLTAAPVASAIFAITIAASLYSFQNPAKMRELMLHPYSFIHHKRYHTIITSGFIHADWPHLLFNMFTFYFFAFKLEDFMVALTGFWGHILFGGMYIISMIVADISSIVKHKNNPDYFSLGASGAIAAVLFSYILFEPTAKLMIMFFPIPIPAPVFAVLYMIYSFYAGRKNHDNVNHEAHLWGAVCGLILTIMFFPGIVPYFLSEIQNIF